MPKHEEDKELKRPITMTLRPSVWEAVQDEAAYLDMSASALAEAMLEAGLKRLASFEEQRMTLEKKLVG